MNQMRALLLLIPFIVPGLLLVIPNRTLNELLLVINYHPPNTFLLGQYAWQIKLPVANITTSDDTACILSTEGTLHCILDYNPEEYRLCDSAFGIQGYSFCLEPPEFTQVMPNVKLIQVAICPDFICGLDRSKHITCVIKSNAHNGNLHGEIVAASSLATVC
jgi:hypothetical protein